MCGNYVSGNNSACIAAIFMDIDETSCTLHSDSQILFYSVLTAEAVGSFTYTTRTRLRNTQHIFASIAYTSRVLYSAYNLYNTSG